MAGECWNVSRKTSVFVKTIKHLLHHVQKSKRAKVPLLSPSTDAYAQDTHIFYNAL